MAPRIASDCFPDEFLTVDYDTMAPMAGGGGGAMGAPAAAAAGAAMIVGELDPDAGDIGTAAAAAAAAMANAELNAMHANAANNGNGNNGTGGDGNNNIENDPLSMGQATAAANTNNNTSIGRSHSSGNNSGVGSISMEGLTTNTTQGTMGTTVTATMAAAAQQAWDQFVAGQEAENNQHQQHWHRGQGHGLQNMMVHHHHQHHQQQQQQQQVQVQLTGQQGHDAIMAMDGITTTNYITGGHPHHHHHHPQGVQMTMSAGGGGTGPSYSPSSIPQAASPSMQAVQAMRGSPPAHGTLGSSHDLNDGFNTATPTTYQQLLAQQSRQDIMNASGGGSGSGNGNGNNDPPSVHSAPAMSGVAASAADRMALAQQRSTRRASSQVASATGQPVPRASSFGGFPAPMRAPGRPTSYSAENNAPPSQEQVVVQGLHRAGLPINVATPPATTVSRSNSVASSLTASARSVGGSTNSYHRFLSGLQQHQGASSPLETVPPSEHGDSSPQETYGSIHSAMGFSTSAGTSSPATASSPGDDSKLSPVEHYDSGAGSPGDGSYSHSPKLPYSPSLLDQTSFPEEEDLSVADEEDDDDEDTGDKYSPISKLLDFSRAGDAGQGHDEEEDGKMTSMDTTADLTMEQDQVSMQVGLSQGIVSHVIHEDAALSGDAPLPATNAGLRPRPSPYARANSSSTGVSGGSQLSQDSPETSASSLTGAAPGGATTPTQRRGLLMRNEAFDHSPAPRAQYRHQISDVSIASNDGSVQLHVTPPPLSFGSDTTIQDLTYYAEKGCIVDVLAALTNPHLKTLGSRMLADYAKMPHRRVAVASNTRILEFVQCTALEIGNSVTQQSQQYPNPSALSPSAVFDHVSKYTSPNWLGREYSVETVRSLTAAEENDRYLMNAPGLLRMLALVARGGPFVQHASSQGYVRSPDPVLVAVPPPSFAENGAPGPRLMLDNTMGVASDKARLHACIAIMNLSCGKSNKIEITGVGEILEAMRDVMLGRHFSSPPRDSRGRSGPGVADEARLKATTCIKNLSNADANDAALLATPGLVETLGYVAEATCHQRTGATTCTTHACLALMNLSISKSNKNRVFRTPGVMDALMAVITRTAPRTQGANGEAVNPKDPNFEARVKACSALSNLAIGYDNKIPMFHYPGFVESILTVIRTDGAEARTKACSILWSFAAEMKNQVPVVQRGDILPALVSVAKEDTKTEARFKCVAALTLLAESPENAVPLLRAGSLEPLMNVLQEAGPDPTQWRGQTASWCVGFLMNMAQCDDVVPALLREGIVDLLAPLLSLDHYQSLKAAMAVTFVCQYDTGDRTYNMLRQTENVIPKIVGLLHNTLSGRGGSGYKYGVFTLRSSVGCIASLAAGPDFMKERIATNPVFESLLKVVEDFCVDGGTPGAIVGGGKDDTRSVTLAVKALSLLVGHLIPEPRCAAMPFGPAMDDQLITALRSFELTSHPEIDDATRKLAYSARIRVEGGKNLHGVRKDSISSDSSPDDLSDDGGGLGLSLARKFFPFPCGMNLHVPSDPPAPPMLPPPPKEDNTTMDISDDAASASSNVSGDAVRTFLLTDSKTGRRYAVPCDPAGGRQFNDNRVWCFRRGRYCNEGEVPDTNFQWSNELQAAYKQALKENGDGSSQC